MSESADTPPTSAVPDVPAYAWSWVQRSRPVVTELARRLTGGPAGAGFVEGLRTQFRSDPFVRDVVIATVAEVAFGGRIPTRRPPGASWDRGLTWWAATIAGVGVAEFEARSRAPSAAQHRLFGAEPADGESDVVATAAASPAGGGPVAAQRRAVARALRQLLETADGDQVPASAVRQLLVQLEDPQG